MTSESREWHPHEYNHTSDLLDQFESAVIRPLTDTQIRAMAETFGLGYEDTREEAQKAQSTPTFINSKYQVQVRWDTMWVHLSIKRIDKQAIHDWRHMQEIKSMLVSPDHEALELYPSQARLVDTANQYHLWVLRDGSQIPVGFSKGATVYDHTLDTGAIQRSRVNAKS